MRRSLPTLLTILASCVISACSKPVSQRMEGVWKFDEAASTASWDTQGTPPPVRKKIVSLVDSGTIRIGNGKISIASAHGKTSVGYEILQDGDRYLVARIGSRDGRKRADIKVEMLSDDILTLASDYPVPKATAVLTRNQGAKD